MEGFNQLYSEFEKISKNKKSNFITKNDALKICQTLKNFHGLRTTFTKDFYCFEDLLILVEAGFLI